MSKQDKLLEKLLRKPEPSNFRWDDLVALLCNLGYTQKKGNGSRRKFYKEDNEHAIPISLHEPHPQNTIKKCYIKPLIQTLKDNGDI